MPDPPPPGRRPNNRTDPMLVLILVANVLIVGMVIWTTFYR